MEAGRPRCLIFPMVSFCDIPLSHSRAHRDAYGDYVIGLTKTWGETNRLNPLVYISSGSDLAGQLTAKFSLPIAKTALLPSDFGEFWPMIPYLKPVMGFQKDGRSTTQKCFDQEMEWRFVPSQWANLLESRRIDNRTSIEKEAQNASVSGIQLKFGEGDIEILIVKTSAQRKKICQIRPALRGKVKLWREIPKRSRGR